LILVVAREGVEPPTRGFSGIHRVLSAFCFYLLSFAPVYLLWLFSGQLFAPDWGFFACLVYKNYTV